MFVTTHFITRRISMISLTLLLFFTTCQCLPQLQSGIRNNNNNFRAQEGSQNNNRNQIPSNGPPNGGQRNLEGGFVPSNFGNELVRFPDNVARPVGRGQPQQSPFRNSASDAEIPTQNNRRPNQQTRPPPRPQRPNQQSRPPPRPQRPSRLILPAIRPTTKFTRPEFDVLGRPLIFREIIPEDNDILPDFRGPRPTSSRNRNRNRNQNQNQNRNTTRRPSSRRPQNSNLGPDLRPKLPIFGQPDLILKATEELRNSDVNQNAILSPGTVNAGVLPLATENEEDQQLGFFPPFNKRIQPK